MCKQTERSRQAACNSKNADGNTMKTTIGSAGVFYKQVNLSEGHNKFAVRAENASGSYQTVFFDINVLNQQILNLKRNSLEYSA